MNHLSRHACNDDLRYFEFTRNSRLPIGTFPRGHRINPDAVVLAVCIAAAALAIVATGVL